MDYSLKVKYRLNTATFRHFHYRYLANTPVDTTNIFTRDNSTKKQKNTGNP